jgi:hypothetical protein
MGNKTLNKEPIIISRAYFGFEIEGFVLGDYQNMFRTLKKHPELDTGDWYSKIISSLGLKLKGK